MISEAEFAAYDYAHMVDAVKDAAAWGYIQKRRWLALYGGINYRSDPALSRKYRQHRAAIRALMPRPVRDQSEI